MRWIVIGCGWQWIPLLSAGGNVFFRPQVMDDFVASRWRFVLSAMGNDGRRQATVCFGRRRWIRLAIGGIAWWIVAGRRQKLIPLVAASGGDFFRPWVTAVGLGGNRWQRAAVGFGRWR